MTYLTKNQFSFTCTLVRKSETRMFPGIERECIVRVGVEILLEISFPDFKSIAAADGDICLFGSLKPFACSCLVGKSTGCRMQRSLGVIQHRFRVVFLVVFGFVLFLF